MIKYILTNKENNRVRVVNNVLPVVLSGNLSHEYSTQYMPVMYDSKLKARLSCIGYGLKVQGVIMNEVLPTSHYKRNLYQISTGKVFVVYNISNRNTNDNRFVFVKGEIGSKSTQVMIKGVGTFPLSDFLTFARGCS